MRYRFLGGERVHVYEGGDDECREGGVEAGEGGDSRHGGGETRDAAQAEVPLHPHQVDLLITTTGTTTHIVLFCWSISDAWLYCSRLYVDESAKNESSPSEFFFSTQQ